MANTRSTASTVIVTLGLQLAFVGLLALIANINDKVGKAVLIFVVGIWLAFLYVNTSFVTKFSQGIANLAQNPSNSGVNLKG